MQNSKMMQKQRLKQNQKLRLSLLQIQFLSLLQIPLVSLESRIQEELEKNPVLEDETVDDEEDLIDKRNFYKKNNSESYSIQVPNKEESLYDALSRQILLLNLEEKEKNLAEYLIGCLDDNGLLTRDLYTITNDFLITENIEISERELENSLLKIQTLDPIGVGARDLQECLLLQLQSKKQTENIKRAIIILKHHYENFRKKNFDMILRNTMINEQQLKEVYIEVEKLNPNPGGSFNNSAEIIKYIMPDFSVRYDDGEFNIKLNKSNKKLFVNKRYEKMLTETNDKETIVFINQKIQSAKWFTDAIKQREKTLHLVMSAIVYFQQEYFISGDEKELHPMKLMDIAQKVNMDISTISRVTNSKYVETPFGTFLLKELFSEAYKKDDGTEISTKEIKAKLKQIIETEDKRMPLTDEQLTELLGKDEYFIARRTVAKYREQQKYPVAKLRKKL